jgi:hypothetical protein
MVESIKDGEVILAILVRSDYQKDGVEFFTPSDFSQQLAFMKHPKGKVIEPHIHNPIRREINTTKEVIFVRKGKLRVDFYSEVRAYLESRVLFPGDVILLASGGHGFEALEEVEMLEVKQGPYMGEMDKTHFQGRQSEGK